MTDAIEILQRDHDEIRRLLNAISVQITVPRRNGPRSAGPGA
jgi:hypothetical protein